MDPTMDLVVFGATGHVLAAAARQQTNGAPDISDFVGDGLWLRDPETGHTRMVVSPDLLSVASVDRRDDVLLTARFFAVVDGLPEQLAELGATPVQLDGATVQVTIPSAAPEDLDVWILIDGTPGPTPVMKKVQIEEGQTSSDAEDLALQSGEYTVLVLAPGYRTKVVDVTI
jgi:hypothetical protein